MNTSVEAIYGLTPIQEGMLFHRTANNDDTSYHIQNSFWMNSECDLGRIREVLDLLSMKHEVFRTAFVIPKSTGIPRQVILKDRQIEFQHLSADGKNVEEYIASIKQKDLKRGFDLQKDSLFRLWIIEFDVNKYWLLFSFHHIIMDGWCLSLVFNDFVRLYNTLSNGSPIDEIEKNILLEPGTQCQYKEYIEWLNEQDKDEGLEYWGTLLQGYDEDIAFKPMQVPVPTTQQMNSITNRLSISTTQKLTVLSNENQVTMNVVAETAWGIMLQKYNYTQDVVFGKVVSGRNVPLQGIENKVGLFISSIPVRVVCTNETSVIELIKEMYEQSIASSHYEYFALGDIQNLTSQGSKLISTIFVFENYFVKADFNDQEQNSIEMIFDEAREQTNYPISIRFSLTNDVLQYTVMYNPNEFVKEEVRYIADWLEEVLINMATNPKMKVNEIEMVTKFERTQIMNVFNNTFSSYDSTKTIGQLFEEQVRKTPNNIALAYDDQYMTYEQMNHKVNCVAYFLRSKGISRNEFVVIIAKQCIETIIWIYGIIKAGAAYIPISPSYPQIRINYILEDSKPRLVLMGENSNDYGIETINIHDSNIWEGIGENPINVNKSCDLAYCIYTSGTTGIPKGVLLEHKGIPNLRNYFVKTLGVTQQDSVLQFASIVFDASVWEMTMALLIGAKLVIPTEEERKNNEAFISLAEKEEISIATLPPIFFNSLEGFRPRILITAGSESSSGIVEKAVVGSTYINAYGPTEFTVAATQWKYNSDDEIIKKIPIGKPICNSQIYILNGGQLCGIGITGELCIAGVGLARGYLNKEKLTHETFADNPFGESKLYRSGDLARWLPNGDIEYLGRVDEQVKIRGFRIELGEIENVMKRYKGVKDVAVIAKPDQTEEMSLYAYFVADKDIELSDMKGYLNKMLPGYMIPAYILKIDQLPSTINGKLDKNRLPEIKWVDEVDYYPPRNEVEENLCSCYCSVLAIERVGIDDIFFEMGGNSIKAMKLVAKLKAYEYEISISDILNLQSIRRISENCFNIPDETIYPYSEGEIYHFESVLGMQKYISKTLQDINDEYKKDKCIRNYPITAMQQHSLENNVLHSGLVIDFSNHLNLPQLMEAIVKISHAEGLLRSMFTMEKQAIYIKEFENKSNYSAPIINLSGEDDKVQKEVDAILTHRVNGNETWYKDEIFERLLYEVIVVKYGEKSWKIYLPFCHVIFDGMSAGIFKNTLLKYYNNPEMNVEVKNSFQKYAQRLEKGPITIACDKCIKQFELNRFNTNITNQNENTSLELVNTIIRLDLGNDSEQIEAHSLWDISYKLFIRLMWHVFGLKEISAAILVANRKSSPDNFFDTIGEFLDLLPISDYCVPKKDYKDVGVLLDVMANNHISFVEFIYNKGGEGKYGDINKIFGKIKEEKLQLPVFNYINLFDEAVNEKFITYKQKEFTTIVDVLCYKTELIIKGFCSKGEEALLNQKLQRDLEKII